jgi:hypothetical protein
MFMTLHRGLAIALCAVAGIGFVHGKFAIRAKDVPVDRVMQNIKAILKKDPKNAKAHYVLGRIQALAFASNSDTVNIVPAPSSDSLPSFAPYDTVLVRREKKPKFSPKEISRYRQSIEHYQAATRLDPKDDLAWLGLGWMLELGAPRAGELLPLVTTERQNQAAMAAYWKAFNLKAQGETKAQTFFMAGERQISLEAAEGILRIQAKRKPTAAERKDMERLKKAIATLKSVPIAVTPIVIPLHGETSLPELLGHGTVRFDLAGDGAKRQWPWVAPQTGILVWDPAGKGKIESGRQLFGSATWWMFFSDGYEAMRSLDDNADGWLSGLELKGIGVWQDRNQNGVSDRGEVAPLARHGITGLAVRPSRRDGRTLIADRGVRFVGGRVGPSFDWVPVSVTPRTR